MPGKMPWRGNGNPFQYSCLENPMDEGAWRASPWGRKESDTTYRLNHYLTHLNTNHLQQYSKWSNNSVSLPFNFVMQIYNPAPKHGKKCCAHPCPHHLGFITAPCCSTWLITHPPSIHFIFDTFQI